MEERISSHNLYSDVHTCCGIHNTPTQQIININVAFLIIKWFLLQAHEFLLSYVENLVTSKSSPDRSSLVYLIVFHICHVFYATYVLACIKPTDNNVNCHKLSLLPFDLKGHQDNYPLSCYLFLTSTLLKPFSVMAVISHGLKLTFIFIS